MTYSASHETRNGLVHGTVRLRASHEARETGANQKWRRRQSAIGAITTSRQSITAITMSSEVAPAV